MNKQIFIILLLLFYPSFFFAKENADYKSSVNKFIKWYVKSNQITDSFIQDSNLFWSVSSKELFDDNIKYMKGNVCLIHLILNKKKDLWISYYIPTSTTLYKDTFVYYNISGQDTVYSDERDKKMKLIKRGIIKSNNSGINTKFYNRKRNLIKALFQEGDTKVYRKRIMRE